MKIIKRFTAVPIILFASCTYLTTVEIQSSNTISNSIPTEYSEVVFQEHRKANTYNPFLEIAVTYRVVREESYKRLFIENRIPTKTTRLGLWLIGIAVAGIGYTHSEQGYVVLGRDLMGLGLVIPVAGTTLAKKEIGELWKPETRKYAPQVESALDLPIKVSVRDKSWTENTNAEGFLIFNIADLADMAEPGGSLMITLQSQEDSTHKESFTVETSVVAYFRTPPVSTIAPIEPAGSVGTIAILDFQGIGVSAQEALVLTNRLATKMVALGTYQVIERGQMEQILQEQDFQLTGCTSSECAVEIGQLIGAQQMLAGSFGKLGTVYTIDMKIIDVETGRIIKTTSFDIEGSINQLLSVGLDEAVRRLADLE